MEEEDSARARTGSLVGAVLGKYRLLRLLGEGGMGSVYEATHLELGKRAAVKTLHGRYADSADARQRFLREGQSAARIRHPNVADVYDVAIEGDHPYLVMELLEGEDLAHFLAREAPISVERAADILLPVVAAVSAAHELGVVHRDLKPENIYLCQRRTGALPKVLDFGISKLIDYEHRPSLTGSGALLGTPHYMSPEQVQSKKQIDARSDQYALGVIAYECVTGRRPLHGVPLYTLIQRTVQGDFPPPRQINPALPVDFERLILKAMARQPAQRYPTSRALGAALCSFGSQRAQAEYAAEFAGAAAQATSHAAGGTPLELHSTLGESVAQELAGPRRVSPRSRWLGAAALLALALVALSLSRWQRSGGGEMPTAPTPASSTALTPPPAATAMALSPAAPPAAAPANGSKPATASATPNITSPPAPSAPAQDAPATPEPRRARRPTPRPAPAAAPPPTTTPPAATAPTQSPPTQSPPTQSPSKPLPAEDPNEGFVDLDGN